MKLNMYQNINYLHGNEKFNINQEEGMYHDTKTYYKEKI